MTRTYRNHRSCTHADDANARLKCRMGDPKTIAAYRLERHWARTFGGTREQFNNFWELQRGRCAICRRKMVIGKGKVSNGACFDHCHKQLKPRGILCRRCNILLGWFEKFAPRIIKYVKENK